MKEEERAYKRGYDAALAGDIKSYPTDRDAIVRQQAKA